MTKEAEYKQKVRSSREWKLFRKTFTKEYFTERVPLKAFNLHHLRASIELYNDLDPEYFVALNKKNHDAVHTIYSLCCHYGLENVIYKLGNLLRRMYCLNNGLDFNNKEWRLEDATQGI